jgi:hypothetical protein
MDCATGLIHGACREYFLMIYFAAYALALFPIFRHHRSRAGFLARRSDKWRFRPRPRVSRLRNVVGEFEQLITSHCNCVPVNVGIRRPRESFAGRWCKWGRCHGSFLRGSTHSRCRPITVPSAMHSTQLIRQPGMGSPEFGRLLPERRWVGPRIESALPRSETPFARRHRSRLAPRCEQLPGHP